MKPDSVEAKSFVIVDLLSQAEAVRQVVQGWKEADIIRWLRTKGDLIRHDIQGQPVYFFTSRSAERLKAGLIMREGRLVILPA